MSSRTRVARWAPPLGTALRLAWRPALAYFIFTAGGSLVLAGTFFYYVGHLSAELVVEISLALGVGLFGVLVGQLVALLRVRALPLFFAIGTSLTFGTWLLVTMPFGERLALMLVYFCFAFPCGLLSLQHRWELFAAFWPSVGWIGAAVTILNAQGRIEQWEQQKVSVWTPVPLVMLACFLVLLLFYFASKQAMRVELWQALSGAAGRRISKTTVSAVPRRNILPLLVLGGLLFVIAAVLGPYLFRTGKGDHDGGERRDRTEEPDERTRPKFDADGLAQQMEKLARAVKDAAVELWPLLVALLILILLYRPAKRALLSAHLRSPVVPTPPTERIDNLWEYVRIAAGDAGVVPAQSDSVEQLVVRVREQGLESEALARAAAIYTRTRYGFVIAPGDARAMRDEAVTAARDLRAGLGPLRRLLNLWRPLA